MYRGSLQDSVWGWGTLEVVFPREPGGTFFLGGFVQNTFPGRWWGPVCQVFDLRRPGDEDAATERRRRGGSAPPAAGAFPGVIAEDSDSAESAFWSSFVRSGRACARQRTAKTTHGARAGRRDERNEWCSHENCAPRPAVGFWPVALGGLARGARSEERQMPAQDAQNDAFPSACLPHGVPQRCEVACT